jgi:hypothetical protein
LRLVVFVLPLHMPAVLQRPLQLLLVRHH